MRYLAALCVTILLCTMLPTAEADELHTGLWTYHFDRDVDDDECTNEKHDMLAYKDDWDNIYGSYVNSHCLRSYLIGHSFQIGSAFNTNFEFDAAIVSGYPSSMHVVEGLVVIPTLTASHYVGDFGIRLLFVPTLLVGGGFAWKW